MKLYEFISGKTLAGEIDPKEWSLFNFGYIIHLSLLDTFKINLLLVGCNTWKSLKSNYWLTEWILTAILQSILDGSNKQV